MPITGSPQPCGCVIYSDGHWWLCHDHRDALHHRRIDSPLPDCWGGSLAGAGGTVGLTTFTTARWSAVTCSRCLDSRSLAARAVEALLERFTGPGFDGGRCIYVLSSGERCPLDAVRAGFCGGHVGGFDVLVQQIEAMP